MEIIHIKECFFNVKYTWVENECVSSFQESGPCENSITAATDLLFLLISS